MLHRVPGPQRANIEQSDLLGVLGVSKIVVPFPILKLYSIIFNALLIMVGPVEIVLFFIVNKVLIVAISANFNQNWGLIQPQVLIRVTKVIYCISP